MIEMPKAYNFHGVEARLYRWWEENGWFKPEARPADAEPFVIAIPPPNVTGELHNGHVLFVALEDLMIRRARMQGRAALWIPGTDHAGIATQLQVEKHLKRTQNLTRHEVGREAFLEHAWAWKAEYGDRIINQLRRLGASCDWDRLRFTLDEGLSRAVIEAFVRLYRMGLIYQGEYLVNWSPGLQTAVSDLEVEYHEEPGFLYYFKYPVKEGGYLPVATTRPETILGDTAVAIHPEDGRYLALIGGTALVPIIGREIPIIADEYVDVTFGTGALKVTPGHDPNDFEIGRRHGLAIINVMNKDATMSEAAGPYAGLDRFDCRQRLWEDMEQAGLTIKREDHVLNVPRSQRGGEIVEPLVSRQWFANVKPMADMALEAVRSGRIRIVPERFSKVWENWLTNIRPWCISRQLWWGHRIPVWYVEGRHDQPIVAHDNAEARAMAREQYGDDVRLEQDPDVLDTWFSSALWPFSTLGWPDETPDYKRFYPTDVMETGYDILFFWVARMVMTGLLFTNDVPFHTVYLHGLVLAEQGKKMSKTAGNVQNPLEVIEEYGTDALRFTLLTGSTPGNDMTLSLDRVASNRNFANKIWNVTRFIVGNLSRADAVDAPSIPDYTIADRWILLRLSELVASVNRLLDSYLFGEAGRQILDFFWNDFADWYVETAKVQLDQDGATAWNTLSILADVVDTCLRLLHPYMPFVTEATWQQFKGAFRESKLGSEPAEGWEQALIIAQWPEPNAVWPQDEAAAAASSHFERLRQLVTEIRSVRSDYDVPPGRRVIAIVVAGDKAPIFELQRKVLAFLAGLDEEELQITEEADAPESTVTIALGDVTCYLPLAGLVDLERERERLAAEAESLDAQIERVSQLLAGPFAERAPSEVVQRERDKLKQMRASRAELAERLEGLRVLRE